MDARAHATATDLCARLAGRLADDTLRGVRQDYFGGEARQAETTLLLSLAHEGVGITRVERTMIRSTLDDPDDPDLAAVAIIDAPPPPPYRFFPVAPPHAPSPAPADAVLAERAPLQGGKRLLRAWREPVSQAPDQAAWVYVVQVERGVDRLRVHSGLVSHLWVRARATWPVEVVEDGATLPPYQAAALAAAREIRAAKG
ncbi:hypothetical protein ACFQV2_15630 [Actinokineospora soli]|uniref:Uncharacterized protein n=1 Tax=Actinokineospora soli TaxID=1048753 RepID=A0ABW2TMV5_9PSEU